MDAITFIDLAIAFIDLATAIVILAITFIDLAIKDGAEQVSVCVRMSGNSKMRWRSPPQASLLTLQQSSLVALTPH
ncbi:hypothetical protein [Nostoc sp.]